MPAPARWCAAAGLAMDVLIASQVGCSLLLLVVTGAMGRTLINLRHVDPGFDPTARSRSRSTPAPGRCPRPRLPAVLRGPPRSASRRMPQVAQVTLSQMGLLTRGMTTGTVDVPGRSAPTDDEERFVRLFFVGPDFFETAGMRIVAGESIGAARDHRRRSASRWSLGSSRDVLLRRRRRCDRTPRQSRRPHHRRRRRRDATTRFATPPARAMFLPFTQAPPRATMTFIVRPGRRRAAGDLGASRPPSARTTRC